MCLFNWNKDKGYCLFHSRLKYSFIIIKFVCFKLNEAFSIYFNESFNQKSSKSNMEYV